VPADSGLYIIGWAILSMVALLAMPGWPPRVTEAPPEVTTEA
jgi:hypothetical protein